MFAIDIVITFNLALYNEDMEVIDDRFNIAYHYVTSWLLIDVVSIVPYELILARQYSKMVRVARLGRIYKILKLLKLIRFFKLQKSGGGIMESVQTFLNITHSFRWFFRFFFFFAITSHVVACFWIIAGSFDETQMDSWMADLANETPG
mgnify:CR=1 FL=1